MRVKLNRTELPKCNAVGTRVFFCFNRSGLHLYLAPDILSRKLVDIAADPWDLVEAITLDSVPGTPDGERNTVTVLSVSI